METQKVVNLFNSSDYENSKFAAKQWYIINNESNRNHSHHNRMKLLTSSLESSLCDYSDAYILVTGIMIQKQHLKIVHHLINAGQK